MVNLINGVTGRCAYSLHGGEGGLHAEETPAEEAAEELDANAVLEVVEAIAEDETLAEGEYAVADAAEYDEEVLAEQAAIDGEDEEIRE